MDHFRLDVKIPSGKCSFHCRLYSLKATSLQEAADMAFSREIYRGEEILNNKSLLGEEPVVKRSEMRVIAYSIFDENGNLKECLNVQSESDPQVNGYKYQHPSRLTDLEIKQLLIKDASINKVKIDLTKLEDMVFLI